MWNKNKNKLGLSCNTENKTTRGVKRKMTTQSNMQPRKKDKTKGNDKKHENEKTFIKHWLKTEKMDRGKNVYIRNDSNFSNIKTDKNHSGKKIKFKNKKEKTESGPKITTFFKTLDAKARVGGGETVPGPDRGWGNSQSFKVRPLSLDRVECQDYSNQKSEL